jgi:hypothetical protein
LARTIGLPCCLLVVRLLTRLQGGVLETLLDGREPGLKREIVLSGWESARRFSCGNGARPRIWSAAFSASMIVGAFKLPLVICGMIDAGKQLVPCRWKRPERQPQRRPKGSRNKSSKRFDVHAGVGRGRSRNSQGGGRQGPRKSSTIRPWWHFCDIAIGRADV